MKLRTKILILTIAAFLLGGYSIAATGIVKVTEMADTSARTQMSLMVTNFANEIDDSLLQIEDAPRSSRTFLSAI